MKYIVIAAAERLMQNGKIISHLEKQWGYFSKKDGENHVLDICEACYDKWRSSFAGAK